MIDNMPNARTGKLIVRGAALRGEIAELIVAGTLRMDSSSVTELAVTFIDADLDVTASQLLDRGSPVDYDGLRLVVASNELQPADGGPQLQVVARSLGVRKLRARRGAKVWRNQSYTQVAAAEARASGLRFVGQPTAKRRLIRRGKKESSWGMIQRFAKEIGLVMFEAEGTVFFGKPTWLLGNARKTWQVTWSEADGLGAAGLAAFPGCRRAEDSKKNAAEITLDLASEDADQWRPGDAVVLSGVPTFSGRYLVTTVTVPLRATENVVVTAETPENPSPEPPQSRRTSSTATVPGTVRNTVSQIVTAALGQAGTRYEYGAEASPTDLDPDAFDCSELVQWACAQAGVKMVDGSAAQLAFCRSRNTLIPVERALRTRGALLFKPGHVAISLGNGKTIEAAGRAYNVGQMSAGGRGWTTGALIPGVRYGKGP